MKTMALLGDARVRVAALTFACFLLGSTGWIAWLYRIADLAEPTLVDFYTMVLGYVAQAVGIGVYMLVRRRATGKVSVNTTIASLVLYVALLEPATMWGALGPTLAFGYAMNVFCGYAQGHYCTCLAALVQPKGRGVAFGAAYAGSTFATWLLSSTVGGSISSGASNLVVCVLLALLAILCVRFTAAPDTAHDAHRTIPDNGKAHAPAAKTGLDAGRSLALLAGATVVAVSLAKNAGFSFPAADLSGMVDLELSRLFYGVGLLLAGIMADRDRRFVLACCGASLATPFLMLALTSADAPSITLWALGYLLFGFFTVFRVLLFADLAARSGRLWIAGAGLALGRVGDALGTVLYLALGSSTLALIVGTAVAFTLAVALLFALYERLYVKPLHTGEDASGTNPLEAFTRQFELSAREQEVLALLVDKMTNVRIAEELCISEPTVKYHVRNILRKTGCTNRNEVIALYKGL